MPSDDCADVAHETIATALDQLRRGMFRGDSSLKTWLVRILRGKVVDYWRRRGRDAALMVPDGSVEIADAQDLREDPLTTARIQGILRSMRPTCRLTLLLNFR